MHKFSTIKNLFIFLIFDVPTHKTTHPVIVDDYGGEHFKLTKRL